MYQWTTASSDETMQFAEALARLLLPGSTITLEGDLGAGKTTFTKGLALGLGVKRVVNSPTFTIIKEYQGERIPLYHMDVYRLDEGSGEDLGLEDYFYGEGITVVEWASRIQESLPPDRLEIQIKRHSETERQINLTPHGNSFKALCKELAL